MCAQSQALAWSALIGTYSLKDRRGRRRGARPRIYLLRVSPQNLQVLRPSRKPLKPGDVFAMQLPSLEYLFGRVISTTARWSFTEDGGTTNLVYVFQHRSTSNAMPDREHLQSDNLLIPPQLITAWAGAAAISRRWGTCPLPRARSSRSTASRRARTAQDRDGSTNVPKNSPPQSCP
jgi:hypothetical protein